MSDRDLRALKRMSDVSPDYCLRVAREILTQWDQAYGSAILRGGWLRLATGGWSENEAIVGAIPTLFRAICWEKSVRGGLHVYRVRRLKQ